MKAKTIEKTISDKVKDWVSTLPEEMQSYVESKIVVTGGCIASMFLKEPVNDYDLYFKNIKAGILVSRHYCKKWMEDGKVQKSKVNYIQPMLRLTLSNEDIDSKNVFKFLNGVECDEKGSRVMRGTPEGNKRVIVHPDSPVLEEYLQQGWSIFKRVEIFIQSQGFLGENPDEEYNYFETEEDGAAVDFIDKSLAVNEEGLNAQESGEKYRTVFMSSNAITLSHKMQLVIRFFGDPEQIHDTYDYIHATNYWTKKDGLVTNIPALEALLSRELIYSGSKYPLASIFRSRKFIKRDWNIHVGNYVKMAMQLNELDLTDVYVLEEQLTGVDAAYLNQIIRAVKDKRKDEPDFTFDATYINTLVDRMMGNRGMTSEDILN